MEARGEAVLAAADWGKSGMCARLALLLRRIGFGETFDDGRSFEERVAIGGAELGDGLCKPVAFCVAQGVAEGATFGRDVDEELAAVGGVRFAFDEGFAFEGGDGGAHGLGFHGFGAGEVSGGGGAVGFEAAEDVGFGRGEAVAGGCGADATDEEADGLGEVDDGGVQGGRHGEIVTD